MNQTEDSTLTRSKRGNRQRQHRNWNAWKIFSPDGTTCRFCEHDNTVHLTASGVPHFYRPATHMELRDSSQTLYRHHLPDGDSVLMKRMGLFHDFTRPGVLALGENKWHAGILPKAKAQQNPRTSDCRKQEIGSHLGLDKMPGRSSEPQTRTPGGASLRG